jgi:hypothetical protein
MSQSLFENGGAPETLAGTMEEMSEGQEALRGELALLGERLDALERRQGSSLQKLEQKQGSALEAVAQSSEAVASRLERRTRLVSYVAIAAVLLAAAGIVLALVR